MNDWRGNVKVEIPQIGISLGELNRYLRAWLGTPAELESVTFGLKCDPQQRARLTELVRRHYPQCSIQQIRVDRGELIRTSV